MESDFDQGPEFVSPAGECYFSSYSGDKVSRSSEIGASSVFFKIITNDNTYRIKIQGSEITKSLQNFFKGNIENFSR